jgi:hypothetical protein
MWMCFDGSTTKTHPHALALAGIPKDSSFGEAPSFFKEEGRHFKQDYL